MILPKKFKMQAIRLRKRGLSYNEIKRHMSVAKSTLSLWLKNIPLSEEHHRRLYTKQIAILSRGSQSQKERRMREIEKIIQTAASEIKTPLTHDTYRLMGAALYWAEGTKRGGFEVTNSDPYFILFMVKWIEKIFGVLAQNLRARLNIYPQQNDVKIKRFWSELTQIPVKNFGKSFVKPISKGYKKNNLYYGTIKVELPKGTDTKHRVFGWIQAVLNEIDPRVKEVQQKWIRLTSVTRPINLK